MLRMTGTLHGDVSTLIVVSRLFLPGMRNVWVKVVEKIKTHLLYSITFFFQKTSHLWDEIMWKNKEEPDISQMTIIIQRMHFACWLRKATHTFRICNNYCFFTVTVVTRTRHNVTLYKHCLSCYILSEIILWACSCGVLRALLFLC